MDGRSVPPKRAAPESRLGRRLSGKGRSGLLSAERSPFGQLLVSTRQVLTCPKAHCPFDFLIGTVGAIWADSSERCFEAKASAWWASLGGGWRLEVERPDPASRTSGTVWRKMGRQRLICAFSLLIKRVVSAIRLLSAHDGR